jgi:hypothetical protein
VKNTKYDSAQGHAVQGNGHDIFGEVVTAMDSASVTSFGSHGNCNAVEHCGNFVRKDTDVNKIF